MTNNIPDRVNENTSQTSLRASMELERMRALDCMNRGERLRKPSQKPVDNAVYRDECNVLPDNFLEGIDLDSMLPTDFKSYYPHGTICCLAVLPFNDGFYGRSHLSGEKWDTFVKAPLPNYLRAVMVQPSNLTHGFADIPARYYDLFPSILARGIESGGASFMVDYNRGDGMDDREWFLSRCNRALENLRRFFNEKSGNAGGAKLHLVK